MNKGKITISYTVLRKCALLFIALPLLCFFLGWLKWYWAGLACIALSVCLLTSWKQAEHNADYISEKQFCISVRTLILIVLISTVFSFFCGVGRFWAQSNDYPVRNAVFRDLILYDWPVYYDKYSGALSYYIAIWLPAALPGKLVSLAGGSAKAAFLVGNICLFVYFVAGLTIMFLLIARCLNVENSKHVCLLIFGFFFFSGLDAVAPQYEDWFLHFEWWSGLFQYSSMTTCICWVFNQALIPWICMALILNEKTVSDYILIGMCCLLSGPFPFVGYFIYCLANGVKRLVDQIKIKEGKKFAKEFFSVSNICSVLFVFPFVGSYLMSNSAFDSFDSGGPIFEASGWVPFQFVLYLLFLMIEFGIFAILIFSDNKKNYLFYITLIQLIAYPLFHLGDNSDFTMRASLPGLFVMYVLCYQYLLKRIPNTENIRKNQKTKRNIEFKKQQIPLLLLVLCLIIGAVTPSAELLRGCFQVYSRGINDPVTDGVITLNQETNPVNDSLWPPRAYVALNLDEQLFFKYFARKQE